MSIHSGTRPGARVMQAGQFVLIPLILFLVVVVRTAHADSDFVPVDLGTLGGGASQATAVNARGQVVGYSYLVGNLSAHAFSWTAMDGMVDLGTLGGTFVTIATAVNDPGQVVGFSFTAGDVFPHAFSWTATGGIVDLGTLGGSYSIAVAVNDRGQVVGFSNPTPLSQEHAVLGEVSH
jgi:probable HAF family extracellular repeat protein